MQWIKHGNQTETAKNQPKQEQQPEKKNTHNLKREKKKTILQSKFNRLMFFGNDIFLTIGKCMNM